MTFQISQTTLEKQMSHRSEILRLIHNTNDKIADFNTTPTLLNPYTKQTTFVEQAQRGKEIALAIQVLLINSRTILPVEFFKRQKTENKYKKAFSKPYLFLAEDATQQYEGIIKLIEFYQTLLDAIYSLPDFSDVIMVNTKKQKKLEAGINEDNEDEIFEV